MPGQVAASRLDDVAVPRPEDDPDVVASYLEDASGVPPGRATGVLRPATEAQAAAWLRSSGSTPVLPQAARSSLTSGAVPAGEVVLSVERLDGFEAPEPGGGGARCTVGAGIRLSELAARLEADGYYYPPVPTYRQAMIGGTVSTNAGGADTFKYGATRRWVHGVRVLLFNGDLLDLRRGDAVAAAGGGFRIDLCDGSRLDVPVPTHRLPPLSKLSAGYHASEPLDLVDLFVGSEGTLGVITAVTLDLVRLPEAVISGWMFSSDPTAALAAAERLHDSAVEARAARDPGGPDVRAIEWLDSRSLDILRTTPDAPATVRIPGEARAALLFEVEAERRSIDTVLGRLAALLPDDPLLALPGDRRLRAEFLALRESVPRRVVETLRARGAGVAKVGGDMAVPFDRVAEMLAIYDEGFRRRGLDYAIWGHLGDGNLHPNAIPRDTGEVGSATEALFEFADEVMARGGTPLAEHGVGRSPVKQEMLRRFVGDEALRRMRQVKLALDPAARFAPGVLFAACD